VRLFFRLLLSSIILTAFMLSGCSDDDNPPPPASKPVIVELHIEPAATQVYLNSNTYFEVIAIDENGNSEVVNDQVVWGTETSPAIIEFSNFDTTIEGDFPFAKAVIEGIDNIVATFGSLSASASVRVITKPILNEIIVTPEIINLIDKNTQQLTAIGVYAGGKRVDITNTVAWSSDFEVSVNRFGVVSMKILALDKQVTATMDNASASVVVNSYNYSDIYKTRIEPASAEFLGRTYREFEAISTLIDENETNTTNIEGVVWTSANPSLVKSPADTAQNIFRAEIKIDSTTISMSHPQIGGTVAPDVPVNVIISKFDSITLSPDNAEVSVWDSIQFSTVANVNGKTYPLDHSPELNYYIVGIGPHPAYFSFSPDEKGKLIVTGKGEITVKASIIIDSTGYDTFTKVFPVAPAL